MDGVGWGQVECRQLSSCGASEGCRGISQGRITLSDHGEQAGTSVEQQLAHMASPLRRDITWSQREMTARQE